MIDICITITRCAISSRREGYHSPFQYSIHIYKINPTAMTEINSTLPSKAVPPLKLGASPTNGIVSLSPGMMIPLALAVEPGRSTSTRVTLSIVMIGRPKGLPSGVTVVLPMTIAGALAIAMFGADVIVGDSSSDSSGVIVADPLKVAVKVVKTSSIVVVLSGALDAGLVVGARGVD